MNKKLVTNCRSFVLNLWRNNGLLLLASDALIIFGIFLFSYYIRFYFQELALKQYPISPIIHYIKGSIFLTSAWIYFIWKSGGYNNLFTASTSVLKIRSVVLSGIYALAVLMVISFMYRQMLLSRQVYLMSGVLACLMMLMVRLCFQKFNIYMHKQGLYIHKMLILGLNNTSRSFIHNIENNEAGIRIIGIAGEANNKSTYSDIAYWGDISDLHTVYQETEFDILVMSHSENGKSVLKCDLTDNNVVQIVNFCEQRNISFYMLSGTYTVTVAENEIRSFDGHPLVRLRDASLHPVYSIVKRAMDIFIAGVTILLGMPIWLGIALLIKLTSDGPVFFTQIRAGLHGKPFRMYKFRSMVKDAEKNLNDLVDIDKLDEPVFKIINDPRVTAVGRFLRRTSLDEFPQIINVLKGEMSIVGPRPEELCIVERYDVFQRRRLKAKPGLTGYHQITNRGEPSLSKRIEYDILYLKNQGLIMDLFIIAKTVYVVLTGKGITY